MIQTIAPPDLAIATAPLLPEESAINAGLASQKLDALPAYQIGHVCWIQLQHVPSVSVVPAYTSAALVFKFCVVEQTHRATYIQPNEPVFKDSCVEVFIAVDESDNYYNFEFNSLGTCLASFGQNRHNRAKLTAEQIKTIQHHTKWNKEEDAANKYNWELTVIIPASLFVYHSIKCFNQNIFRVNFYKCGDALPEPHYLAWSKVESVVPDFHQPAYFGLLQLL